MPTINPRRLNNKQLEELLIKIQQEKQSRAEIYKPENNLVFIKGNRTYVLKKNLDKQKFQLFEIKDKGKEDYRRSFRISKEVRNQEDAKQLALLKKIKFKDLTYKNKVKGNKSAYETNYKPKTRKYGIKVDIEVYYIKDRSKHAIYTIYTPVDTNENNALNTAYNGAKSKFVIDFDLGYVQSDDLDANQVSEIQYMFWR